MTINGRQDGNSDQQAGPASATGVVNAGRRRFGRTGLAASGILATLASRPVLGAACMTPSAFVSGNLSTHGTPPACAGRSPGYWKNKTDWPIANRDTAKFKNVFTCAKTSPYFDVTMLTLLDPQDFDKYNLGMHLVAAYLNAMAGWSPVLPVTKLQSMWNELQAVGYFTPVAGVHWTAPDVVNYIQSTYVL
jgi:hypothetical protein